MTAELIVGAMLNQSAVTSLVSTRRALAQLPQNTAMPALVYQVVDTIELPKLNFSETGQRAQSRVQINPLAATVAEVAAIHAAVLGLMNFKHYVTFSGKTVVSCRRDLVGQMERDNDAGVWTQPADYILIWVK